MTTGIGFAGKITKAFIRSKLTPLLVIAALLLGVFAVIVTPRKRSRRLSFPWLMYMSAIPERPPKKWKNV